MQVGSKVWFRGQFAKGFTIRGVIEAIDGDRIGVRLENGNFQWAREDQIKTV